MRQCARSIRSQAIDSDLSPTLRLHLALIQQFTQHYADRLVEHLAQHGFNSRFGARPLLRTIEAKVVTPLAFHFNREPHIHDAVIHLDFDEIQGLVLINHEPVQES